ncbi:hypothetical protein AVEN_93545-1 [Araneus ventricosus]|uniref:Uncharacterized protein n=1 Tax=Araneus ventricosus TaxID=182803 RepID=A0A4Y2APW4_ARAVE|nr:hypothetical protein AVEN_93545-1 [Araneus ventricosus]
MKHGRPSTGGSCRNSNYYVKKFHPSKHGVTSIENYFKSASSSSNETDPRSVEKSSTSTNENVSLLPSNENIFTSQTSTSRNTEICVGEDIRDAINPIEDRPSNNKSNENTSILRFDERCTATSQPSTNSNTEICSDKEDKCINEVINESDISLTEDNKQINQKYNVIGQKYITSYEKEYTWLYYSHSANGFLCKVCSMLSTNGSKAWESIGVDIKKKKWSPTRVCRKHELSKKHMQVVAAQEINKKKGIKKRITEGAYATNLARKNFNRKLTGKFVNILYCMIKKQWVVSENVESVVRFLGENFGDDEIKKHLESCGENATYLSRISVENIVNSIFLEQELLTKLACTDYFTLMADECTDQSQREQLGLIVRYRIPGDFNVEEKYFGQ